MTWPSSVAALLQELIRIPSVNPEGDPGCEVTGESALAEYVGELLRDIGAEVTLSDALPNRPNIFARLPSAGHSKKPRLLFAPHLDTVSVKGMTIPPFAAEVRDGCIWGRGATDTKGSLAAMLWALYKCRPQTAQLPWEICFAGLADEETYQMGSQKLAAEECFDFVLVGEPTQMQAIYRTKGSLWMKLGTRGLAAHGASPERGENAILKMIRILKWIEETAAPRLSQLISPELGAASINIGMINGGVRHNIVPDLCEATLDIRTIPGQDPAEFKKNLIQIFPELEIETRVFAPLDTPPDHPIIQRLLKLGAPLSTAPWFCDASSFAAVGIPAIAIGPGCIEQAHTANEFLKISDLEHGASFFESFLNSLIE